MVLTFRYGRDIGESSRKVAYHPSLVVPCRVLTEFTWFQAKIKIEIENLCVYYWIALYLIWTFRIRTSYMRIKQKSGIPSFSSSAMSSFDWIYVISSKNQNWNRKKICVYNWIALYLVWTFRYGRDIWESSRKVAYHPSLVVWCRVLAEFTWFQAKSQNWSRKSLCLLLNRFLFDLNF